LRSTDFAFDQGLACSDQDWHSGSLALYLVERQTKGENTLSAIPYIYCRYGSLGNCLTSLYGFFIHIRSLRLFYTQQVPLFGGGVAAPFPGYRRSSALLQAPRLSYCQCLNHPLYRELGLTLAEEERFLALIHVKSSDFSQ
jgi:hypothetical protein